ncbi:MAG: formylglycine-generating enzyme family protein [Kiritimatiellae bacterium]|nr:formylglycine-generating enzyme family protein [Kiritimatiellia bacterium]
MQLEKTFRAACESGLRRGILTAACAAAASAASALEIADVTARQRWPWNNLVDVTFQLSGAESSETFYRIDVSASYPGMAGDAVAAKSLVSEPLVKGNGSHTVVWDMGADLPCLVASNLTVSVSAAPLAPTDPVYMIVDLSDGASATSYPVRYSLTGPDLSDDTCRTSEMWFRLCPAGTFTMGAASSDYATVSSWCLPAHSVTLTKPFWLGVFEVTQEQYYRIRGSWPSHYSNETYRATRPVEKVGYDNDIRRSSEWYGNTLTGEGRFMARLRNCTGLAFDLPTEAQWEYACRAGTTGLYYDDAISSSTIAQYARVNKAVNQDGASGDTGGTAKVGSFAPNPWGFYDMYGNVAEICGDGNPYASCTTACQDDFANYAGTYINPRGPVQYSTPTYMSAGVVRGGSISDNGNGHVTSVGREQMSPNGTGSIKKSFGFRVCLTAE